MSVDILDENGRIIGKNNPLNGIADVSNVRNLFKKYSQQRDQILNQEEMLREGQGEIWASLNSACKGVASPYYRVIDSSYLIKPFIFKYKNEKKGVEPLSNYKREGYHLRNSLGKTVLGDESIEISIRAKRTLYILYDFEFHNTDSFSQMSFWVRSDLMKLISYIIDSSYSPTYRILNTTAMVEALRLRLNDEEAKANI